MATPAGARDAGIDTGWILSKLARPAPMQTNFVETRSSKLLKSPLRIYGQYARPDDTTLVRAVRAPYEETTTIRGTQATITRAGHGARTFSLTRVPELASMKSSFGALLSGDQSRLQQDFALSTTGTREHWRMVMTPKSAVVAKQLKAITLYGRGAELRCIETQPANAAQPLQRTLLASAATAVNASTPDSALETLCRGD